MAFSDVTSTKASTKTRKWSRKSFKKFYTVSIMSSELGITERTFRVCEVTNKDKRRYLDANKLATVKREMKLYNYNYVIIML